MAKIFLFGPMGAGKSTICAALSLLFFEEKGFAPLLNLENVDGSKKLLEWVDRLRDGRFPEKTLDDVFVRVDAGFEALQREERAGISFFEVSGENLVRLSPLSDEHEICDERLKRWLEEADLILLVAPCDSFQIGRREALQFLSLLDSKFIARPLALVLTKWDLAQEKYKTPLDFARAHYPEAIKVLATQKFKGYAQYFTFSIGEIWGEGLDKKIRRVAFENGTRQLFNWIVSRLRKVGG
jgi:energy-coupling factor transporter ATP-binding protein EcfA2